MATEGHAPTGVRTQNTSSELGEQWRRLTRSATVIALLTSPVVFLWMYYQADLHFLWALAWTFLAVVFFRGIVDVIIRRFIPWPSLFGTDDKRLKEEDVINRRRAWFWRKWIRRIVFVLAVFTLIWAVRVLIPGGGYLTWWENITGIFEQLKFYLSQPQILMYAFIFPLFFIFNFLILLGPLMLVGITQMRGFEPGDADWGVRLGDVRGQDEAKQEVSRVVSLWQSGEAFEAAGGKRERGLLFLGPPGTGKTMLAKAIATGFNCPFVSMPGSGFQQTFMGMDAVIVRYLAWKAKRLAAKWGGQCIVFIDEIDAVGMRRSALGGGGAVGGMSGSSTGRFEDFAFYGEHGALNPSEDLILETRPWRDRMFEARAPVARPQRVGFLHGIVKQFMPGMMGGGMGQLALNQLLVVMDGIDSPPFFKSRTTNWVNTFLDASYIVPRSMGNVRLRLKPPKPRNIQIYFIGATNVPINVLDPALIRPGRMGRHVWLRTPTKRDRLDIFDLYIDKVDHEPELDTEKKRDEIARITNGYSPAMIEQVCSMALTYAHSDGRERFDWSDIVEAMTTIESGMAIKIEYIPEETRAVAIHEAGHAVAGHVYMKSAESTRLSIRRRGDALGHHQALEKEERFSSWRSEEMARLIWTLGAMAAERVFYGENSTGVGGDVQSATARAAWMVGACAMAPERIELNGRFKSDADAELERKRIGRRFEAIGKQIMNRAGGGGPFEHDPLAGVMMDHDKRAMAAQLLGQAYVAAHLLMEANKPAVEHIADVLVEKRELHGDEILGLLDEVDLKIPEVDLTDEQVWPKL